MNSYLNTPSITAKVSGAYGPHTIVDPQALEVFKTSIEAHIQSLTYEVQTLRQHANWIEPRLQEFLQFNKWMEQAHPDIIEAYKKSTAVADKLERAIDENHGEVMAEASA
jgi:hypothetical protein